MSVNNLAYPIGATNSSDNVLICNGSNNSSWTTNTITIGDNNTGGWISTTDKVYIGGNTGYPYSTTDCVKNTKDLKKDTLEFCDSRGNIITLDELTALRAEVEKLKKQMNDMLDTENSVDPIRRRVKSFNLE